MRNHKEVWLEDTDGNLMILSRHGQILGVVVDSGDRVACFEMTATHVGKMFEYVVDMFFPGGKGDESTEDSQDSSPK